MPISEQIFLFVVSYIANTFSAFAGGGAGLIQLPLLIFLGLMFSTALAPIKWPVSPLGWAPLSVIYVLKPWTKSLLYLFCSVGFPG